jgi:hypothetical protein
LSAWAETSHAQNTNDEILKNLGGAAKKGFKLSESEASTGKSTRSVAGLIGDIIQVILGFAGTVAFIIFLYGGFLWLTARGNDEQVSTAKKYLTNGLIGTIIIIMAYSLTYYITDVVFRAATG